MSLKAVCEVAATLRRVLEPGLQKTTAGSADSGGACLHASVFVASCLNRYGLADVKVVGGDGDLGEGAMDRSGQWRGHYWVEGKTQAGGAVLVDITSDQFGYEEITVGDIESLAFRYRRGDQQVVNEAAIELGQQLGLSLNEMKWQESK